MSTALLESPEPDVADADDIRDDGALESADPEFRFEDDLHPEFEIQNCLAYPWVTYVPR